MKKYNYDQRNHDYYVKEPSLKKQSDPRHLFKVEENLRAPGFQQDLYYILIGDNFS